MPDILWAILFFGIAVPILVWAVVSPFVFVWWVISPNARDRLAQRRPGIVIAICIGAFISLVLVLGQGIEAILAFIPSDLGGYDEDGELRGSLAYMLAVFVSVFFIYVFSEFEKMRAENRRLSVIEEIQKRRRGLNCHSRDALVEKRDETEAELAKLRALSPYGGWSTHEGGEIRILEGLLEELEHLMQETSWWDALDDDDEDEDDD